MRERQRAEAGCGSAREEAGLLGKNVESCSSDLDKAGLLTRGGDVGVYRGQDDVGFALETDTKRRQSDGDQRGNTALQGELDEYRILGMISGGQHQRKFGPQSVCDVLQTL